MTLINKHFVNIKKRQAFIKIIQHISGRLFYFLAEVKTVEPASIRVVALQGKHKTQFSIRT